MKLFISVPMSGRDARDIKRDIRVAYEYVINSTNINYELIDSYLENDESAIYNLGESIKMMRDADAVYFCDGWINSRGCNVEREVAVQYDIKIIE